MTHKGTLVGDLQSVAEACLQRNSNRICANCGQRFGDHYVGDPCPDLSSAVPGYLQTKFLERLSCSELSALRQKIYDCQFKQVDADLDCRSVPLRH